MVFMVVQWEEENSVSVVNEKDVVESTENIAEGGKVTVIVKNAKGKALIYVAQVLKICASKSKALEQERELLGQQSMESTKEGNQPLKRIRKPSKKVRDSEDEVNSEEPTTESEPTKKKKKKQEQNVTEDDKAIDDENKTKTDKNKEKKDGKKTKDEEKKLKDEEKKAKISENKLRESVQRQRITSILQGNRDTSLITQLPQSQPSSLPEQHSFLSPGILHPLPEPHKTPFLPHSIPQQSTGQLPQQTLFQSSSITTPNLPPIIPTLTQQPRHSTPHKPPVSHKSPLLSISLSPSKHSISFTEELMSDDISLHSINSQNQCVSSEWQSFTTHFTEQFEKLKAEVDVLRSEVKTLKKAMRELKGNQTTFTNNSVPTATPDESEEDKLKKMVEKSSKPLDGIKSLIYHLYSEEEIRNSSLKGIASSTAGLDKHKLNLIYCVMKSRFDSVTPSECDKLIRGQQRKLREQHKKISK